nr:MAG TPA: hypothetical protein [Caudoviricetes sp.]
MAIKRVIANKRYLMIRPYELDSYSISTYLYDPSIREVGDGAPGDLNSTNPSFGSNKTNLYGYGTWDSNNYNQRYALILSYFKRTASESESTYTQRQIILCDKKCIYNYDDSKYSLKVITSNVVYSKVYNLKQYFENKKLFKIVDIYLDNSNITNAEKTANIKIYYLEKK